MNYYRPHQHHHHYQGPYVRTEGVRPEQQGDAIRYDVLSVAKEVNNHHHINMIIIIMTIITIVIIIIITRIAL